MYKYEPYNLCFADYRYQITDLTRNMQYIILVDKSMEPYQWQFLNLCDFLPVMSNSNTYIYVYELFDEFYKLYDYINKTSYLIKLNDIVADQYVEYIKLIDFSIIKKIDYIPNIDYVHNMSLSEIK